MSKFTSQMRSVRKLGERFFRTGDGLIVYIAILNFIVYWERAIMMGCNDLVLKWIRSTDPSYYEVNRVEARIPSGIQALFVFGISISSFIFGYSTHLFNLPLTVAKGITLYGVGCLIVCMSAHLKLIPLLFIGKLITAIGQSPLISIAPILVTDNAIINKKAKVACFYLTIPVGSAFGFAISLILNPIISWNNLYLVVGAIFLTYGTLCYFIPHVYYSKNMSRDTTLDEAKVPNTLLIEDEAYSKDANNRHRSFLSAASVILPALDRKTSTLYPSPSHVNSQLNSRLNSHLNPNHPTTQGNNSLIYPNRTGIVSAMNEATFNKENPNTTSIMFPVDSNPAAAVKEEPKSMISALYSDFMKLMSVPMLLKSAIGASCYTAVVYGLPSHFAAILVCARYFDDYTNATMCIGFMTAITSTLGTVLGGFITVHEESSNKHLQWRAIVANMKKIYILAIIGTALYLLAILIPGDSGPTKNLRSTLFIAFLFSGLCLVFAAQPPLSTSIILSVQENKRALATGIATVILHIFGDLPSPYIFGEIMMRVADRKGIVILEMSEVQLENWRNNSSGGIPWLLRISFLWLVIMVALFMSSYISALKHLSRIPPPENLQSVDEDLLDTIKAKNIDDKQKALIHH